MTTPDIRYPPEPLDGETRKQYHKRALNHWRMDEKWTLLYRERGWTCEREGCEARAAHLDEAIVTRRDAMGLPTWKYRLVFASCNFAVLCPKCNTEEAHDRDGAWERACERYGQKAVANWYQSLSLKVPREDWIGDDS